MDRPITLLICTKHTLLREGIKALFARDDGFAVAGEAITARSAIEFLERDWVDVVLMDPSASDMEGPDATRLIKAVCPHAKVLLLALDADASLIARCVNSGASAYINGKDHSTHLRTAIHAACRKTSIAA